jgi:glycosyltransferase involved in cell wall biosynthesis
MKKKVVIFTDWFLPGYKAGGPVKSIKNLIDLLKDKYDFSIITSDRDFGDNKSYKNIKLNTWIKTSDYKIYYANNNQQTKSNFSKLIQGINPDYIYINGVFSPKFSIIPLLVSKKIKSAKTIVSPRGMLGSGALKIKSKKKKIFLMLAKAKGIYKNIIWHATTPEEKFDIQKLFGKNTSVRVAENLPSKHNFNLKNKPKKNPIKFIFCSRICEKKNLKFAINLFTKINPSSNFTFDIYGPIEDEKYWNECHTIIQSKSLQSKIAYKGELTPNEVYSVHEKYHFYFLPTYHENYGHSIVEAMQSGCVPIISNKTPWINLETNNAGWDIPLKEESSYIKAIENAINMSSQEYSELSISTVNYINENTYSEEIIDRNYKLFS